MEEPPEESCCICLGSYDLVGSDRFVLSCGHHIHSSCMLRYCLGTSSRRCPLCRRSPRPWGESSAETSAPGPDTEALEYGPLEETDNETEGEIEGETEGSDDGSESDQPQWLRLTWCAQASSQSMRIQKGVVALLLRRAKSARAPAVLKRCLQRHRALKGEVVKRRRELKQSASSTTRSSIQRAVELHRRLSSEVKKAIRTYQRHHELVLKRCQASSTIRDYFCLYPLQEIS